MRHQDTEAWQNGYSACVNNVRRTENPHRYSKQSQEYSYKLWNEGWDAAEAEFGPSKGG